MERRDFLQTALVATGGATLATPSQAKNPAAPKFKMKYGPHFGMFKNTAGDDLFAQLQFMADQGFTAFEDNGMMGRTPEIQTKIGETLAKLGIEMGVFVVDKGGNGANTLAAGKKEYIDIFLNGCKRAVEVAKRCNAKWMTVVPGDFARNLPIGLQTGHVIDALRRGAEILEPHGLVMVLEPLSDSPDLFLRTSDQTYEICRAVNSSACKILFDIYHMQKNEGRIIQHIDWCYSEIGYVQIGDEPRRCEPTTGEINYKNIFKHLHSKGYTGILGMEHGNFYSGKEGEDKLIAAYRAVDLEA